MSYCIEYNPELKRKYPKVKFYRQIPIKKVVFLLIFFVSACLFIEKKGYRYLLPGDPDTTIAAFSTMVEQVGDGAPVKDAVRSFCEEIIMHGIQ